MARSEAGCIYCGFGSPVVSLAEVARAMSAGAQGLRQLLPQLADHLGAALPGGVEVQRRGHFGRDAQRIRSMRIRVGELVFLVDDSGEAPITQVNHEFRGVAMSHDDVGPDEWLRRLAVALQEHAARSGADPHVLARHIRFDNPGGDQ